MPIHMSSTQRYGSTPLGWKAPYAPKSRQRWPCASATRVVNRVVGTFGARLRPCNQCVALHRGDSVEALSGLARAFFYAQARALLVSQWEVNSAATVKLITMAADEIARNKSVGRAEALRRSMLALINKGQSYEAHPAYWAPFMVVGEGAASR